MDKVSRVIVHMGCSADGFIARKDGRVDWMETSDRFEDGAEMDPEFVREFLASIDCYVMGSKTYETALDFESKGFGWSYGDTPVFVLTRRDLPVTRQSVELVSEPLESLIRDRLRPRYGKIWIAGGSAVAGECLRLGLTDEVSYSMLPVLIGEGMPYFDRLDADVPLHLLEARAYKSGMVALRYEVRR